MLIFFVAPSATQEQRLDVPPTPVTKNVIAGSHPTFTGRASWYGPSPHKMANGKWYPSKEIFVAHRYFPFGTKLRIEYVREDNKPTSIEATVTDRGPHIKGRELDLSVRAAEKLGIKKCGVAEVSFWVVSH